MDFGRMKKVIKFDRVDSNEKEEITKAIGDLLETMPTGGNYQFTVGKVEKDCDNKICEITLDYFEKDVKERRERGF